MPASFSDYRQVHGQPAIQTVHIVLCHLSGFNKTKKTEVIVVQRLVTFTYFYLSLPFVLLLLLSALQFIHYFSEVKHTTASMDEGTNSLPLSSTTNT